MTTTGAEAAVLSAVGKPVCSLEVRIADGERVRLYQAWIGSEASALRLDADGHAEDLITVETDHVPAAVARILRLGPRVAKCRETVTCEPNLLDRAFSANDAERADVAAQLLGSDIDRWRISTVESMWPDARRQLSGRALVLADSPGGLYRLTPAGSGLRREPVTPTEVWRLVIGLLPADAELVADSA